MFRQTLPTSRGRVFGKDARNHRRIPVSTAGLRSRSSGSPIRRPDDHYRGPTIPGLLASWCCPSSSGNVKFSPDSMMPGWDKECTSAAAL